jgi:hypothetical protein
VELGCRPLAPKKSPQSKRLLGSTPRKDIAARTFGAPDHRRCFYGTTQDVNLPYKRIARHPPGNEQPIISITKSFDKKN